MAQWIVFHLTERCGLSCRHCLRDPGKQPDDLPLAIIEKALDEAAALRGIRHAGFTGGDPLLHRELPAILDAVVRRGFTWHLVSSGRRLERLVALLDEVPARREALTILDLSLDGATAATHDGIRGEGSFREVMGAMAVCGARGIPFAIQMTLNARNAAELEQVGLLAADMGARVCSFSMMNATGSPEDPALWLPQEAWDRLRDRIGRLGAALKIEVRGTVGFRHEGRATSCEPFRGDVLHVDPHGRLNLCCNHSGVAGATSEDVLVDLRTGSLAEGHRRLYDLVHRLQAARLAELEAAPGAAPGWGDFPCNWCLAKLGKPHWVDGGAAGPKALVVLARGKDTGHQAP